MAPAALEAAYSLAIGRQSRAGAAVAEILWAPSPERRITTNVWAFLHWLGLTRAIPLPGWEALAHWSETHPRLFAEALQAFAGPGDSAKLAARLLFLDLRPDDHVLALTPFAGLPATAPPPAPPALLPTAADHRATILIAQSRLLAEATAPAPARADLTPLRTLLAVGGPMSPAARVRIYSNVKSDLLLLAAADDRIWGNPLGPVLARPRAAPALAAKPPPSAPDAP